MATGRPYDDIKEALVRERQTFPGVKVAYELAEAERARPPFRSTGESADDRDGIRYICTYDPEAENGRDGAGASERKESKEE